jgi:Ser/Thr protein kinase RdoA (MazF antagonist)
MTGRGQRPARAAPVPDHVASACRLLEASGEEYLKHTGPFRAAVVRAERRAHSTIHVVSLRAADCEQRFFLKTRHATPASEGVRRGEVVREYQLLGELWDHLVTSPQLAVVKPVALLAEDLAFLTEEFPGCKLDALLASGGRLAPRRVLARLVDLCELAGLWLARFQAFTAGRRTTPYDVSELLSYCEERIARLVDSRWGGLDRPRGILVMRHLERLARAVDATDLVITGRHNDFRPDNMLARDNRVAVLDFTGFTYGPRLYDFMKFWMRLEYLAFTPLPVARDVMRLKNAFRQGYGGDVDLQGPMAQVLRLANILDKLTELVELPRLAWRGVLNCLWTRDLHRQVSRAVGRG